MKVECSKGIGFYPYIEIKVNLNDNDLCTITDLLQNIINKKTPTTKEIDFAKRLLNKIIINQID